MKSLADIERELAKPFAPNSKMHLASRLPYAGAFGLEAAVIQLAITRARQNGQLTLQVAADTTSFIETTHGIIASYFAHRIQDSAGQVLDRRALLQLSVPRIEAMYARDYVNTSKGQSVALICFGGARREFLPTFYQASIPPLLRDATEFISEFHQICRVCLRGKTKALTEGFISAAGSLVFELFRNTHEHASRDLVGNEFGQHCRGFLVRYLRLQRNELIEFCGDDQALLRYFGRTYLAKTSANTPADLLEISVVDSGPGLARRWLSSERKAPVETLATVSLADERNAVDKCFRKHLSTKRGSGTGVGLTQVVNAISRLDGLLRLRSGRLCVYASPGLSGIDNPISLADWFGKAPLAEAQGLAYSIIVPIGLRNQSIK